jgi:hypothetical protein
VDVGDLPNHVKYCVSVLYPPLSNYQNTPGPSMGVPKIPQQRGEGLPIYTSWLKYKTEVKKKRCIKSFSGK